MENREYKFDLGSPDLISYKNWQFGRQYPHSQSSSLEPGYNVSIWVTGELSFFLISSPRHIEPYS